VRRPYSICVQYIYQPILLAPRHLFHQTFSESLSLHLSCLLPLHLPCKGKLNFPFWSYSSKKKKSLNNKRCINILSVVVCGSALAEILSSVLMSYGTCLSLVFIAHFCVGCNRNEGSLVFISFIFWCFPMYLLPSGQRVCPVNVFFILCLYSIKHGGVLISTHSVSQHFLWYRSQHYIQCVVAAAHRRETCFKQVNSYGLIMLTSVL